MVEPGVRDRAVEGKFEFFNAYYNAVVISQVISMSKQQWERKVFYSNSLTLSYVEPPSLLPSTCRHQKSKCAV